MTINVAEASCIVVEALEVRAWIRVTADGQEPDFDPWQGYLGMTYRTTPPSSREIRIVEWLEGAPALEADGTWYQVSRLARFEATGA